MAKNDNEELTLRQLQEIELQILDAVDAVCRKHNIRYYLGEGSLLGAMRHQGFIPWDDDMDLLMTRDEYDRFLAVAASELAPTYELQHASTIHHYWSPFIKIRLLDNSRFAQNHIAHLTDHNGPYIDIFPVDNVPQEWSRRQHWQSIVLRLMRCTLTVKLGSRKRINTKWVIGKLLSPFFSVERIHKILDKTFRKFNDPANPYYVNLASYHSHIQQTVPKEWYGEPRYVPFEGRMAPVPAEAEKILTRIYGDYMTPPPEYKQVIKHHFGDDLIDTSKETDE